MINYFRDLFSRRIERSTNRQQLFLAFFSVGINLVLELDFKNLCKYSETETAQKRRTSQKQIKYVIRKKICFHFPFTFPVLVLVLQFIQAVPWGNVQQLSNSFRLSGLVFHQHQVLCTLTRKMSDFEQVMLELDKIVFFIQYVLKGLNEYA